jgi:hypothetical protein
LEWLVAYEDYSKAVDAVHPRAGKKKVPWLYRI